MPRFNVEHNGQWAYFSSVSDAFLTEFMNKTDYEDWRKEEEGKDYLPLEQCNKMTIQEAAFSISLNRTREEAKGCFYESGLSKQECDQIMYDMETKHYCPRPKENGKFECPNCREEVEQNQEECTNETCCLEFVWRK